MFSQLANNVFNAEEASKNRRWQESMYEKQFHDNLNLWKMQQDYNSPVSQVERLKSAGINPSLALSNISTGSAQSAPAAAQAGSGAQANGVPANFAGLTEGILNLLKSKDERNLMKEQANKLKSNALLDRIDALTRYEESTSRIISNLKGSRKAEAERMLTDSMRKTEDELRGYKVQQYMDESHESLLRQVSQMNYLQYLPIDKRLQYSEIVSNIALNYANRDLSVEKAAESASQVLLSQANKLGVDISNKIAFETMGFAISEARGRANRTSQPQNLYQWTDDHGKRLSEKRDEYLEKVNKYIYKPSKRLWKDTKRAFGLP